ncbi:oxidoreductase-like domain-containing protein [Neptunomonas antarctica]|uniref:Oxidoreductase-like protein, N-terminal n=1 Tax=Neptunomonas antarctica TaxID=619304 RepID=A0A1N7IVR6_9GAMM|nr:oxidoreductase-like domain-containing protein [Neptunomonas antarctica]SIS41134.1 Oxidoreductase-like protein, N-terminal [Neptunomonas antarctica]
MTDKPTPPGDYECCESACEPCVWDTYYEEMREWKQAEAEKKAAQAAANEPAATSEH